MSKDTYVQGEDVIATALRLVNLGPQAVTVSIKSRLMRPIKPPQIIANKPSLQLGPGADKNHGPKTLFKVGANTPRGAYALDCRLSDPVTKELLASDVTHFTVQ